MGVPSERRRKADTLAKEALRLPAEARSEFLDRNCQSDPDLRQTVEEQLRNQTHETGSSTNAVRIENPTESQGAGIRSNTVISHYRVIAMLGAGGMGQVYLAEDTHLHRRIALKLIASRLAADDHALRRLEHEAQAASALNHPNILTVYEFGSSEGLHFIASEYVEGMTLKNKIHGRQLNLESALDIAIQIASALAAAHASGIVHRDIKPANIIIRPDGIVKVLDFGIAKLGRIWSSYSPETRGMAATSSISLPGMVLGTPNYMSPEQARGHDVDGRSDIFSLGTVMYEMVTGREAFEGHSTSDVIAEILKTEPAPAVDLAPGLPLEIQRIITKAMRKDRESRYQSVRDMLIDLQDFKGESEFAAKLNQSTGTQRARPSSGWRASHTGVISTVGWRAVWKIGLTAVLLIVLALGSYLSLRKFKASGPTHSSRTLAVLPFQNLSPGPQTDFLGFSLADEIITKLGYVNSLTVRPSSSVAKYRGNIGDPKKVAGELNVGTLLTGNYLRDGDALRITTQLIDVGSDRILWRDSIDLQYGNLLDVQDRVAKKIIKELELNLSPSEAAHISADKPINSLAYEYYLRGIDLYSLNQFAAAIGMLEKSTEIEPNYAPAWAHLGRCYTTYASLQFGGREYYQKAQAAYEKALTLDPALVEPRIYMANLFTDTGRVEQAVPLLRSVLRDSANNAEAHWELGYAYRFGGMLPESIAEAELARKIDPLVKINSSAMNSYLYVGEYNQFLQSLPVNDSAYILFYRGLAEDYLDRPQDAIHDFDRAYDRDSSSLQAMIGKALSYSLQNQNSRGLEILRQTEKQIQERGVTDAEGVYKIAQAYAVLGDKASALRVLQESIAGGFFCYPYFQGDPLLHNLNGMQPFEQLMQQARQRHEQFQHTFF